MCVSQIIQEKNNVNEPKISRETFEVEIGTVLIMFGDLSRPMKDFSSQSSKLEKISRKLKHQNK